MLNEKKRLKFSLQMHWAPEITRSCVLRSKFFSIWSCLVTWLVRHWFPTTDKSFQCWTFLKAKTVSDLFSSRALSSLSVQPSKSKQRLQKGEVTTRGHPGFDHHRVDCVAKAGFPLNMLQRCLAAMSATQNLKKILSVYLFSIVI